MWNDTDTPLAYFISFRTYGTWLHGDKRGSIDRNHNLYGSPYIEPNERWRRHNQFILKAKPLILNPKQRRVVDEAIRETCRIRKWSLLAVNARTNHVHTVVTASPKPESVLTRSRRTLLEGYERKGYGAILQVPGHSKVARFGFGMKRALKQRSTMFCMVRERIRPTLMIYLSQMMNRAERVS